MHTRNESDISTTSTAIDLADIELRSRDSISRDDASETTVVWSPASDSSFTSDLKTFEETGQDAEHRRLLDDQERSHKTPGPTIQSIDSKKRIASWRELPRKDQLALLICSRLSEPILMTSVQAYRFYQLQSFDPTLSEDVIASQIGWMSASFTIAQFCTAFAWGRASDSEWLGRKRVLLIGLLGSMIAAMGFGFSRTFNQAIVFTSIGGALNGNMGVMRTMVSEVIKEKRFQSRAFMLLPMTFNIGVIIGPILGGILSDPVKAYPDVFGPGSWLGGESGVWWMVKFPYALPNLVCASFLLCSSLALFLGLEETHETRKYSRDRGREIGQWIARTVFRRSTHADYDRIDLSDEYTDKPATDVEIQNKKDNFRTRQRLPLRRIFTRNVIITLASHGLLASHVGTFNNLWFTLLSTARYDAAHTSPTGHVQSLPFIFSGGLAMSPATIGLALSILGGIGITLQLFVYPRLSSSLGIVRSYRLSLLLFPISYSLAPYLALIPSSSKAPDQASGPLVWLGITSVLFIQVLARTFALPGATILVNNCCPHPSVLGSLHGIAQSVSSGARTLGPAGLGWMYGNGLRWGIVGTAWWTAAVIAVVGCFVGGFVREGGGHEILLEGEERCEK